MLENCEKPYPAKSSDLHTPGITFWAKWSRFITPESHDLNLPICTLGLLFIFFFSNQLCQPLFRWTHFKDPVRFLLLIQIHSGLAENSVLRRRFGRQVKLRPLQVETQPCSDGFDETLFQGLHKDIKKERQRKSHNSEAQRAHASFSLCLLHSHPHTRKWKSVCNSVVYEWMIVFYVQTIPTSVPQQKYWKASFYGNHQTH